jgi:hypothetical protein
MGSLVQKKSEFLGLLVLLRITLIVFLCVHRDMSKMINVIMEALWDREFMSKHSLTGKKAPTDKSNNPAKPALPKDDVQAITSKYKYKNLRTNNLHNINVLIFILGFVVEFWATKHKLAIDPSMVHPCITTKLLGEHTANKSREKLLVEEADDVPALP